MPRLLQTRRTVNFSHFLIVTMILSTQTHPKVLHGTYRELSVTCSVLTKQKMRSAGVVRLNSLCFLYVFCIHLHYSPCSLLYGLGIGALAKLLKNFGLQLSHTRRSGPFADAPRDVRLMSTSAPPTLLQAACKGQLSNPVWCASAA